MKIMKKQIEFFIGIFSIPLVILILLLAFFYAKDYVSYRLALKDCPSMDGMELASFKIYGRSDSSLCAELILLDSDSYLVSQVDRSWNGVSLEIQFVEVRFENKIWVFPELIVSRKGTGERIGKGLDLSSYYSSKKGCKIFGKNVSAEERKKLARIWSFARIKKSQILDSAVSRVILDLGSCENDIPYILKVDSSLVKGVSLIGEKLQ